MRLVGGVVLALFVLGPVQSSGGDGQGGSDRPAGVEGLARLEQLEQSFQAVIDRVAPSVVGIRAQRRYVNTVRTEEDSPASSAFEQLVAINGSGAVIDRDGLILTNEHVVQSASDIEVYFSDGKTAAGAVLASDPRSDLAIVAVNRRNLVPVKWCDWSQVARGQWAIAVGNPYGLGRDGQLSAAVGVISNLGRRLPGLGEVDDRLYADMLQTTAAIHPGNSGGPLFNIHGEVVGVITAMHMRAAADEGVGFAIPLTDANRRLVERMAHGLPIEYGYLGIKVRTASADDALLAGLSGATGVVVERVDPDGPAATAGVREGDLVTGFDGQSVQSAAQMVRLVGETPISKPVTVSLVRGTSRIEISAVAQQRQVSRVNWMRGAAVLWRGMRLAELTPTARERMGVGSESAGVVVIGVAGGSPAERAAVQIGDVIDQVDGEAVTDVLEFQRTVRNQHGTVRIRIRSRGERSIAP